MRLRLVCFFVALLEGSALAEGPDSALAQSLFERATELVREGRYAEACPKLAESQRLEPAGGTLLNLGICYEKAEKYTSAYLAYTELLGVSLKEGHKEREQIARERIAAVQPKLSKVVIEVEPATAKLEGIDVRFDGAAVREVAWGAPTPVDMGEHVVTASATGREATRLAVRVDVPGRVYTVRVPELALTARPPVVHTKQVVNEAQRAIGFTFVGLGVAALGAGITATAVAVDKHASANSLCTMSGCDPRSLSFEQSANEASWVANIAYPAAAVFAAAGVIMLLTSSHAITTADLARRFAVSFP